METPKHSLNTIQNFKFGTPAKSMETNSVSKVRVIVRVRPFLPQEILSKDGNLKSCISVLDQNFGPCDEVAVHLSDPHTRSVKLFMISRTKLGLTWSYVGFASFRYICNKFTDSLL